MLPFPSNVHMDIYNKGELRNSSNVMGVIQGSVEPGELINVWDYLQHVCM